MKNGPSIVFRILDTLPRMRTRYFGIFVCPMRLLALVVLLTSFLGTSSANLYSQVPSVASFTPGLDLGTFAVTSKVRIVVNTGGIVEADSTAPSLLDFAKTFRDDLLTITSFSSLPPITVYNSTDIISDSSSHLISLSINTTLNHQYFNGKPSNEGYEIRITPQTLTVQASAPIGIWWGTRTVLQQIVAAVANGTSGVIALPLGDLSDSPGWEVRGFMLDAGRHWFEAGFLGEIEFTLHLLCSY